MDPWRHKLGDLQGAVFIGGEWIAFTQADETDVNFVPGAVEYRLRFDQPEEVTISMEISLLSDDGMVVLVENAGTSAALVRLRYGQMQHGDRLFTSAWYKRDQRIVPSCMDLLEQTGNRLYARSQAQDGGFDYLGQPPMTEKCCTSICTDGALTGCVCGEYLHAESVLSPGEKMALTAVYERAEHFPTVYSAQDVSEAEKFVQETRSRYMGLLKGCQTKTPSLVLEGGFSHCVQGLESVHIGRAWAEMKHWWHSYFAVNYQISAALLLGYYDCLTE